jgi:hypothetical protein
MRRALALVVISFAAASCTPFGGQTSSSQSTPNSAVSPSPSGPLLRALWVLSPVGLNLREQPSFTARALATVPQGTQVTATAFNPTDVGWYQVTFQGQSGWLASKDKSTTPVQALVTTHPQLSYANPAAGYYFLYPATWQISDRGVDVEAIQSPPPDTGSSPVPGPPQSGQAKMSIHQSQTVSQLPSIPTTPGQSLDQSDFVVGGITAIKHTYNLNGGGLEGDVKVQYADGRALLITFRGSSQPDLDTFVEILESFGFSVPPPGAQPAPSPSH